MAARRAKSPAPSESARIAEAVGKAILGGEYAPGDVLPGEFELGAHFAVSRPVVRETLKTIAAKGLIEQRRRVGTRVCERRRWQMLDPQLLAWRLSVDVEGGFVRDLLEIREVIEPAAAAAAARAGAEIEEIELAFAAMQRQQHDRAAFIEPDLRFHTAILAATGNEFYAAFGALIGTSLQVFLRIASSHQGAPGPSIPLHGAVLDSIRARDPDAARVAMSRLLQRTRQNVERTLSSRSATKEPEPC